MKKILLILSFVLLFGAAEATAQNCKDVRIPRGKYSVAVKGMTTGNNVCYRVRASGDQTITLQLNSADKRVKFSLFEDYFDSDFTAENVRYWQGGLGNVDSYLVYVSGAKAKTPFTLEVTIR